VDERRLAYNCRVPDSASNGHVRNSRPFRIAAIVSSLLLGLILPLMLLEATLRWFGPVLPGRYSSGLYQEPHPIYGRFQIPNTSGWYRADEFVSHVQFNGLGLREREISQTKPTDERRVLVLGDSFVQGVEVDVEQTLTRKLEQRLRSAGESAVVINAGVAGFSTDQELLLLENLGWSLQPDVVVLVFYIGNDVTENSSELTKLRKPRFTLTADGTLEQGAIPSAAMDRGGVSTLLRRESRLVSVFDTGVIPKLRTVPGIGRLFVVPADSAGPEPVGAGPGGSDVYRAELNQTWQNAWLVTDRLLGRLSEQTRARNVPLLLIGAPSKWEVYPDDWQSLLRQNNLPISGWDLNAPEDRLAAMASRLDIKYVSAGSRLREASSSSERQYFRNDVHWTPAGHNSVAEAVAAALMEPSGLQAWTRE
jgi:lysophospholipase L1-like esterase